MADLDYEIEGYEFGELVEKISDKLNTTLAIAFNLISKEGDAGSASLLGLYPACLGRIYSGESDEYVAKLFGMTPAENSRILLMFSGIISLMG